MSKPDTSGQVLNPTTPDDATQFAGFLVPDPLLQSDCFIDPAATADTETLIPSEPNRSSNDAAGVAAEDPISSRASDFAAGAAPSQRHNSDGAEAVPPTPENADSAEESKNRRRQNRVVLVETPDWLPPGWFVEDRVRSSGATAGTRDKYYCDPVSGRIFRSKKEVLYYLETGTPLKRRKQMENSDAKRNMETSDANGTHAESSGVQKQKNRSAPPKPPPNFDWDNVPERVDWVLMDASTDTWIPYINNQEVPESVRKEWAAARDWLLYQYQSKKR